ncbi:SAM-dependent methyltransferase [Klenkia taihuensis]|uniref:Methyltransferase domain-containing protein n=1 Tax=Klenkia taihuensis TaxID=1225127 RepID=A0A1I1GML1_9ACTN|nr:class I SAM-dependent methyltransferase [Klenkia taihuensis]GHE09764.1 methyltransferase type 11 [Klenkia taihuensis]SFC10543.1 Methyltransferase domain-containing protein [Klenkia taihuensis]
MTELADVFWAAHTDLPREAPGSVRTTELLLALAGPLPDRPRTVDVGSGTGPASVLLAELTGGEVTAVDLHAPFLAAVTERARGAGVADRVHPLRASMDSLPLQPGSVDLVWAEGSAYAVGVDAALAAWRPLLAPGGVVVLTEAEWTTADPAPGARAFWDPGYPAMRDTAGNVAAFRAAGWVVQAAYLLPDADWAAYYDPLAARIEQLRAEGVDPALLDQVGEEIAVREAHAGDYGYTGYVLRPR